MKDYGKEAVLVIPENVIRPIEGFNATSPKMIKAIEKNCFCILRNDAEGKPALKQVIPYCVLINRSVGLLSNEVTRYFFAQRLNDADRELKGMWTMGIGGHINPEDFDIENNLTNSQNQISYHEIDLINSFWQMIITNAKRELREELEFEYEIITNITFIGFVYTEKDEVSKDHLGLVLLIECENREVKIKSEFQRGGFYTFFEWYLLFHEWHDFLLSIHTPEEIKEYGWQ